ncbi:hypothetical protein SCLCIDRAFT_140432 [Scleroderma citrinum Foug A]|uniref:hAT-like transposase RNase-H fold domain-containing protein n=1 Tax=Scleroderma citrinum Foug A TaxID=1036808 RepID=A0A0C2ZJ28_9AGAM|nr:hypothetical protein SCLCIDRAFT_140432 [Scleroderma citrinum Foug A]
MRHAWRVLEQLPDVLAVLKDATLFFSCGMPNLTMVIPAMDYIDEVFTTSMLDHTRFDPAIHAAIGLAKKTLNKYYSLTDSSKVYCIAMILHPCYKLEYFKQAKWNVDWIDTA